MSGQQGPHAVTGSLPQTVSPRPLLPAGSSPPSPEVPLLGAHFFKGSPKQQGPSPSHGPPRAPEPLGGGRTSVPRQKPQQETQQASPARWEPLQGSDARAPLRTEHEESAAGTEAFQLWWEDPERTGHDRTPDGADGLSPFVSGSTRPPGPHRLSGSPRSQGEVLAASRPPGGQGWDGGRGGPGPPALLRERWDPGTGGWDRRRSGRPGPGGADPGAGDSSGASVTT